jgi:hypothetical protein
MKLSEIKVGQFFTIDNTRSYPKLRTSYGYIDARDDIKKEAEDLPWVLELMTDKEVFEEFKKYGFESMDKLLKLKEYLQNL